MSQPGDLGRQSQGFRQEREQRPARPAQQHSPLRDRSPVGAPGGSRGRAPWNEVGGRLGSPWPVRAPGIGAPVPGGAGCLRLQRGEPGALREPQLGARLDGVSAPGSPLLPAPGGSGASVPGVGVQGRS